MDVITFYKPDLGLYVKPIIKSNQIERIKDTTIFRKFQLVSGGEVEAIQGSSLSSVIRQFEQYQGQYISILISMGHTRKRNLNSRPTAELIREAYYSNSTTFLKACIADSSDTKVETIDLLKDRESVVFSLNYSKENLVTHERLYQECKRNYHNKLL